ncbi:transmembrane protease serine 9-like [Drosophila bipectinata]|uniref:transmembrane protease serine 9-like n=1 Tax=Drosophila bipectinata TaxID=42026 RepID=UPI0038B291A9
MNKALVSIIAGSLLWLGIFLGGSDAQPDGRIVGGDDASSYYTKYVVQLRRRSSPSSAFAQTCGGSILNSKTIVTAAHCVYNRDASDFLVVAGTANRAGMDGVVVRVEQLIPHELYNATITNYDIALVIVDPSLPLESNKDIEAIDIVTGEPAVGVLATVSGWGYTLENGFASNQLQQVRVPIVNSTKCQDSYNWRPISEAMLCAGYSEGGKDACQGDSGGPLVVDNKLAGIVSFGEGCARPNYPGVYANVAYFKDWLSKQVDFNSPSARMYSPVVLLLLLAIGTSFVLTQAVQPEPRIINGTSVDIARHPYIVSLRYRRDAESSYKHECAGVIYSENALLTSAQCLYNLPEGTKILAVAGANTRNGTEGIVYPISNWTYHSSFDTYTVDYDIGVLFLDTPLNLTHFDISAIGIRSERPAVGRLATVAGWGYREEWGPSSYKLEQAQVPVVSSEQCNELYGAGEINERMICAGYVTQGGTDACQGDTGGPLVIDGQLVGLVSWGRGCARPNYPTVYCYVASLVDWIEETINAATAGAK